MAVPLTVYAIFSVKEKEKKEKENSDFKPGQMEPA